MQRVSVIAAASVLASFTMNSLAHADELYIAETPMSIEELREARGGIEIFGYDGNIDFERQLGFQTLNFDDETLFDASTVEQTLATANDAADFARFQTSRTVDTLNNITTLINNTENDIVLAQNFIVNFTQVDGGFDFQNDVAQGIAATVDIIADFTLLGSQF